MLDSPARSWFVASNLICSQFVGAAAYTGSVTHSLSIAVIVCETTGQLSPLLPVLVIILTLNHSHI